MTEFTKGQVARIQDQVGLYRGIDFSVTRESVTTSPPSESTEACRVADPVTVTVTVTKRRWF